MENDRSIILNPNDPWVISTAVHCWSFRNIRNKIVVWQLKNFSLSYLCLVNILCRAVNSPRSCKKETLKINWSLHTNLKLPWGIFISHVATWNFTNYHDWWWRKSTQFFLNSQCKWKISMLMPKLCQKVYFKNNNLMPFLHRKIGIIFFFFFGLIVNNSEFFI